MVTARDEVAEGRLALLPPFVGCGRIGVGPAPQEGALDVFLEMLF